MSYTRPSASAADATWLGAAAYTRPAQSAADATWAPAEARVDLVATVPVTAALSLSHGVVAGIAASLPITAALELEHAFAGVVIDVAAQVPVAAAASADVGVSAGLLAAVPIAAALSLAHGVDVAIVASLPITAGAAAAHGVVADAITATLPITAAINFVVPRYEVRGEVRLDGMLVNRRVRCYKRSTGELVGQADTVAGLYRVPVGFDDSEVYATAIHLDDAASDWLPPTANRLIPVLASDTA